MVVTASSDIEQNNFSRACQKFIESRGPWRSQLYRWLRLAREGPGAGRDKSRRRHRFVPVRIALRPATCKLPRRNTGSPLAVSSSCPSGQGARTPLADERGAACHSWQRAWPAWDAASRSDDREATLVTRRSFIEAGAAAALASATKVSFSAPS